MGLSTMMAKALRICCALGLLGPFASGCALLPRDGPQTAEVMNNAEVVLPDAGYRLGYALVTLSPHTLDFFAAVPQRFAVFSRASAGRGAVDVPIGIGDTVNVSIFEAAGGGLFLPEASRAGNFSLPPQELIGPATSRSPMPARYAPSDAQQLRFSGRSKSASNPEQSSRK